MLLALGLYVIKKKGLLFRKVLLALNVFLYRLLGQADESSGADTLSDFHTIASNIRIACLSVEMPFVVFGAVPIILNASCGLPV